MAMAVAPPLGVIDDEWQLFAAHVHLPAPVFQMVSRPVPPVDVIVPVHVYSSCIEDGLGHSMQADLQNAPVHKSWAEALKSSSSGKPEEEKHARSTPVPQPVKQPHSHILPTPPKPEKSPAPKTAPKPASHPVAKPSAVPSAVTGGVNTAASNNTSAATAKGGVTITAGATGNTKGKAAAKPTAPNMGANSAQPSAKALSQSGWPSLPSSVSSPILQQDAKIVTHTATSTIITDSKGVKTVVAKKGAATTMAKPKPQTVTSGFTTVTAKKTVTTTNVVVAKPAAGKAATSNAATKQAESKGSRIPAGLPSYLSELNTKVDVPEWARFYVIKSYSEDDIHKSIKYSVWASTENGNRNLEKVPRHYCPVKPLCLSIRLNLGLNSREFGVRGAVNRRQLRAVSNKAVVGHQATQTMVCGWHSSSPLFLSCTVFTDRLGGIYLPQGPPEPLD